MPNCLKELIISLDIFGQGINLTIDKQATSQTILGGLLAIILVVGLGTLGLLSVRDVIDHKNPLVTNELLIMPTTPQISLDSKSFPLAFRIADWSTAVLNLPKYFLIEAYLISGDPKNLSYKNLPLKACTPGDFKSINEKTFYQSGLNGTKCIDNQNVTLQGTFVDSWISYLGIYLSLCNNQTSSIRCAPLAEIEQFINNGLYFLEFLWVDSSLNLRNYDYPLINYINAKYKSIVFNVTKLSEQYISNQVLETDDGLLWKSNRTEKVLSFDKQGDDSYPYSEYLIEYVFYSSNKVLKTHRAYERLQSTIAGIGGLINVCRIAFTVICYMFSTIKRDETILNKIFDYDINHSNLKLRQTTIELKKTLDHILESRVVNQRSSMPYMPVVPSNLSSGIAEQQCIEKNNSNNFNLDKVEVKPKAYRNLLTRGKIRSQKTYVNPNDMISFSNLNDTKTTCPKTFLGNKPETELAKKIHELLHKKTIQNNLHFSFFQIIQAFLCHFKCCLNAKLKEKKDLFLKSKDAICELTDITYIIQKMEEIERLKFILLNNDQLCLFNFITKNLCTMNPEKERANQIEQFKNITREKITRIAELILAYKSRPKSFGNNISDDMNSRLHNLLIEELKNLF